VEYDLKQNVVRFERTFDRSPELLVEAPGRINLIGGSTDYNEGFVLPVAIDRRTMFLSHRREDERLKAYSTGLSCSATMVTTGDETAQGWLRYLSGILTELSRRGYRVSGLDLLISGDLPIGSGLGSSAAFEVGFLSTLRHLNGLDISDEEMIKTCHSVENEFVGMKCGIMDQFISIKGKKKNAILLDCRDMSFEYIDLDEEFLTLILFDSGVKRELIQSDYNTRRSECFSSIDEIRTERSEIRALRDLALEDLPWLETFLEPIKFRRCRHIITEIDRVQLAGEALRSKDMARFGELMKSSHISLRDDFEVSCEELNHLFSVSLDQDGVFGARLIGAGFGGNLLTLCQPDQATNVIAEVSVSYRERFGSTPGIITCCTANGVSAGWIE
jgi:galactokinase